MLISLKVTLSFTFSTFSTLRGCSRGVCIATWPADKTPYRVFGVADLEIDCAWCLLGSMLVSPDLVVA